MKKAFLTITAVLALLAFVSCGGGTDGNVTDGKSETMNDNYERIEADASIIISEDVINTVRAGIFGDNTSYRGNGYGLWDAESNSANQRLVGLVSKSGVTNIRFPGGIEGDYYHWKEIIGNNRKPQVDPFSNEYPAISDVPGALYDVVFGIDEFLSFCSAAGVRPVLQISTGTGTPEEGAELVRYCLENGMDVPFFAVGNECYSNDRKSNDIADIRKTPKKYVEFYNEFYTMLGDDAGKIKVGAIGVPTDEPLCRDPKWDETVIGALAGKMDFYDVHIGYTPLISVGDTKNLTELYLCGGEWVKSKLRTVENDIKKYAGEYADGIGISISEWGTLGGGLYDNSLAGAVYVSSFFNTVLKDPKVVYCNHLPLLNQPNACNIVGYYKGDDGVSYYWNNISSYIFRWYSEMTGREVLDSSYSGVTVSSSGSTVQPAVRKANGIDYTVFNDKENRKITVIMSNRDSDSAHTVSFEFPFGNLNVENVRQVWNADPLIYNSWSKGELVKETDVLKEKVTVNGSQIVYNAKACAIVRIDLTY